MCANTQDGNKLNCDYLIVGAGTANLSFVDTLLDQLPNATFILVDRFSRPGGHWTTAYPFVRLHQPSMSYGVNSLRLGKNLTRRGVEKFDRGDRATGEEVCEYYAKVIEAFRATKRVKVYFNTEYAWSDDAKNHHLKFGEGKLYSVDCRKVVRCESRVVVPSMRKIPFPVDNSVTAVALNALPEKGGAHNKYVIIGAGKSGTDAVLYLLANGVDQSAITWVISRDIWYYLRDGFMPEPVPGKKYHAYSAKGMFDHLVAAPNTEEFFLSVEKVESVGRLDPNGPSPEIFKGAAIDKSELETLRTVKDIVRLGRVTSISSDQIILERGTVPFSPDSTLVVDCMAEDFFGYYDFKEDFEVFNTDRICLGPLSMVFNPSFTSALTAFLEARFTDDAVKNSFLYFAKGEKKGLNNKEWFILSLYYQMKTVEQLAKYKPALMFFMNSRTNLDSPMHHGGVLPLLWAAFGPLQLAKKSKAFIKRMEEGNFGGLDTSMPGKKELDSHEIKLALRTSQKKKKGLCRP